jgi:prepilin-type N-terminal cleavage/methylation domain-containing protein
MNRPAICHTEARYGFTMVEVTAALAVLGLVLLLVAGIGTWSLGEQARLGAAQVALEQAVNVLESARACRWEALSPAWAAAQRLPAELEERRWKLHVRVEPEAAHPEAKRVTVEVDWSPPESPGRPARLVGIVSTRKAPAGGGKS